MYNFRFWFITTRDTTIKWYYKQIVTAIEKQNKPAKTQPQWEKLLLKRKV